MRADSSEDASTETLGALNDSSLGCALGTFSQMCLCLCVFEERRAERMWTWTHPQHLRLSDK